MARRNLKDDDTSLNKICFVICPIGDEGTKERDWSDTVLDYIISPVVRAYGYKAIRADDISAPGRITNQIVEKLIKSELVIADLTSSNPNVFYELAIRHATKRPCIQMIKIGENIPFDTRENRTIFFDVHVRSAEKAKSDLDAQVKNVEEGNFESDNPIRSSMDLMKIIETGKPKEIETARIFDKLSEMQFLLKNLTVKSDKLQDDSIVKNQILNEMKIKDIYQDLEKLDDEIHQLSKQYQEMVQGTSEALSVRKKIRIREMKFQQLKKQLYNLKSKEAS